MARVATFRSAAARTAYCRLYEQALASSSVPLVESDIQTSFGTTHVLRAGDPAKPWLVALHGKSMGSASWLPLLPTLTATHHVTMLDAVGDVNKSVATRPMTRSTHVVAWLEDAMRALSIDTAAFAGLSIGAWMAARYAIAQPAAVERLVLLSPAGIVSRQHASWMLGAAVKVGVHPTEARAEQFFATLARPSSADRLQQEPWRSVARQFAVGTVGFRPASVPLVPTPFDLAPLAASRIPTLVVIGRNETLHDGVKMAGRFEERLPEAQVELIDDANHLIPVDQPEAVAKLLVDFLG